MPTHVVLRLSSLILLIVPGACVSPIHAAVAENNPTAVRAALEDGADINEGDPDHGTPIQHAVRSDKLRAAAALMKTGADATVRDRSGLTVMHIAALQGHGKIIRMLLRYGVSAGDVQDGLAPLHRASIGSEAGHTDAVFALLEGGAAPDQPAADGKRPIELAGSENTRKLLMEALHEKRRR